MVPFLELEDSEWPRVVVSLIAIATLIVPSVEKPGSSAFWRCCVRSSIWPLRCRAAQGSPTSREILSAPRKTGLVPKRADILAGLEEPVHSVKFRLISSAGP